MNRSILSEEEIARSLKRIAHEILESVDSADDLIILGIPTRGSHIANRLAALITEIEGRAQRVGQLDITLYRDDLANHPTRTPEQSDVPGSIDGSIVILVDDVLFSGRTVRAALDALRDYGRPKAVKLAVLVDRGHRELPIRADFVGKNLPSAKKERVNVRLREVDGDESVQISDGAE